MDLTNLPTPDQVVTSLLTLAGASTGVLALYTIGSTLLAWYQSGKTVVSGTAKAHSALLRAWATLGKMKPVQVFSAAVGTFFVMGAQILTLWLCYISANIIWIGFFDPYLFQRFTNMMDTNPSQLLTPGVAESFLVHNWLTTAYVTVGALIIVRSYVQSFRGKHYSPDAAAFFIALPASLLTMVACAVVALAGAALVFVGGITMLSQLSDKPLDIKNVLDLLLGGSIWLGIGLVSALYAVTCRFAVAGAERIVRTFGLQKKNIL